MKWFAGLITYALLSFAVAQESQLIGDTIQLGNRGLDVGNYIIPVSTGGFLTVGYFAASEQNTYQGAVIKLDENGEVDWIKNYRGSRDDRPWSVAETPNGDFMITGFTNSFKDGSDSDVWLFRISAQGDLLWEKSFGGTGEDLAWDIKATNDGNYVIAAQTGSKGAGNFDAWVIKVDGQGNVLWDKTYGGPGRERIFSISQGTNSELYATGIYKKETRQDPIDVYTVCIDNSTGELVWEDYLDWGDDDTGHGLIYDSRGGVLVAGYTTSMGNGQQDGFLVKYDAQGNIENTFTYGGSKSDRIMNVVHGQNNELYLVGYSESYGNSFDMWVAQTNYNGDLLNNWTLPGNGSNRAVHMIAATDKLIIVGMHVSEQRDPTYMIWKIPATN